jgi:hypothetical protein
MSMTHELINVTTSGTDVTSATIYPQRHDDEAGVFQVSCTAGTITNVFVYGRLGSDHAWHQVETSGAMNTSTGSSSTAGAGVISKTITIYPQMYVLLDVNSSPSCVVSIME